MKNFRKVLALILVVATLFSFVAMASAKTADEYSDYAEVNYVEAVDVLTALGINEGYNGAFHPADTIDRDEVAAMVARLKFGGDFDADKFVGADNVFADVKGQWSEGYVTYCAQLGIIAGRNASTFDPDGKVTGTEVLKMLLCVLGYQADKQGYTGPNWQVAVVRDAIKMDLIIDDVDVYAPATREEVAQYFLNALSANLVYGYIGEGIVKLSNSLLRDWSDFITLPDVTEDEFEITNQNAVITHVTLADALGITQTDVKADCFGRPAHQWKIGSWKGLYTDAPIAKYTTAIDAAVDYPSAKATDKYNDYTVKVIHNGKAHGNSFAAAAALSGNGVLVEVYATGTKELTFVVIDTFMSTVVYTNDRKGEARLANSQTFDNSELGAEVDDVVMYHACNGSCGADVNVFYWWHDHCGEKLHDAKIVEYVEVEVEETHRKTQSPEDSYIITEDGKTYEYSANLSHELRPSDDADVFPAVMDWQAKGTKKWLFLDEYGYIQYYMDPVVKTVKNVAYFVENTNTWTYATSEVNGTANDAYSAQIVDMAADGPKAIEKLDKTVYDAMYNQYRLTAKNDKSETKWKLGVLAQYYTDADTGLVKFVDNNEIAGIDSYIDGTNGELVGEKFAGKNYHFNADTEFLVRTMDFASGEYTYEAATGYKAETLADYVGKVVMDNVKSSGLVAIPTIQYIDDDADGIIDYLFVDAFYKKATGDYVYVVECDENIGVASLGKFFPAFDLYKGIVNGEEAYVAYYGIGASERVLKEGKLYQTKMQAVNATYKGQPIYVALEEADELNLSDDYWFDYIKVEDGQITLIGNSFWGEILIDRLASNYDEDLTVVVIAATDNAATDLGAEVATYTGAEFVEEFQYDEWVTGTGFWREKYDCYAIKDADGVITTLIIEFA